MKNSCKICNKNNYYLINNKKISVNNKDLLEKEIIQYKNIIIEDELENINNIIYIALLYDINCYIKVNDNIDKIFIKKYKTIDGQLYSVINNINLNYLKKFIKRLFDIIVSIICLIISIPIILLAGIFIKIDSKGPIIYKQKRVTYNEKEFTIYKLRSMINNAEKETGPLLANTKDKRITRVGAILRKYKIDELPQFYNVLKGDMSIVGPRPERKFFLDKIYSYYPEYKLRTKFKAGITCLAHLYGNYQTEFRERLNYDLLYMQNWNIFLDIKLILFTILKVIRGK